MSLRSEDDISSLEKARKRLYEPGISSPSSAPLVSSEKRSLPHAWERDPAPHPGKRHVRLAGIFLIVAFVFFVISLGAAGYFLYYDGGNTVSVDKISIGIQGPTTIAGGDTVPLSLTITNKNPVAIENATIEIDFPNGTLSADGTLSPDPRYVENIGTIGSGATITRSIKAILFGGQGQTLSLPVSFSYGISGSSSTFVKKSSYALAVSSTPLSVSVDALSETVSGKPLTFTLTVRSNATIPLNNVVLASAFPFGFIEASSSLPIAGSNIFLGTLQPGAVKTVTITGTLTGQDGDLRVFHFSIGTVKSPSDQTLAISYMTQDASITIAAPFITTTLALNGNTGPNLVVTPGSQQSVVLSYANTLSTSVTDATISIALSGSAIDYNSIETTSGFYDSTNHTITFSKDTDPSLAQMAPGASGIGAFTFTTLPSTTPVLAPTITFTISVSGTRVGQTNVPENVTASVNQRVKVATAVALAASSLHNSGPLNNSGPIPPHPGQATTYTIEWNVQNGWSPIAGGTISATLPSYVSYTGKTFGTGSFSYDDTSRTVSWDIGDLAEGADAHGAFQVSITPSTSQQGSVPTLTGVATLSGYDRFAGVQVSATADPSTTETIGDSGYASSDATVQ
ncbi:hypothetical protein HKL94_01440 [Candidatus Parcubacteria bacterium]|nr:hypothetical protein [Candidatus Parcubacteria bacterium]